MSSRCAITRLLYSVAVAACTSPGAYSTDAGDTLECYAPETFSELVEVFLELRPCSADEQCIVVEAPLESCDCWCGCTFVVHENFVSEFEELWECGDCRWGIPGCIELTRTACGDDGLCYALGECSPFGAPVCGPARRCTFQHVVPGEAYSHAGCLPRIGSIPSGGTCAAEPGTYDECQAGYFCAHGVCSAFCRTGTAECAEGFCLEPAVQGPEPFGVCAPPCDPLAPDCGEDKSCYLPLGIGAPGCAPTGGTPAGQPCDRPDDCEDGHACADDGEGELACRRICAVDGSEPTCDGAETCAGASGSAGVCL
jgi:hypothetical protein